MKFPNFIITFGWRLLRREWPKYSLAFLSLFVTSVMFTVVLVGVDGARRYLGERAREFAGGDLALESNMPIDIAPFVAPLREHIVAADRETSLLLTVRQGEAVTGVSARAISQSFPLYGKLELESGAYVFPAPDEAYVERVVLERLGIAEGGGLLIGNVSYRIRGVIVREPDALAQGFRLAPRMILSEEGLQRSGVSLDESRDEYEYRFRFDPSVTPELIAAVAERAEDAGLDARIAGSGDSGIFRRLAYMERFFLITALIGAILAAVNVYANSLTLIARMRKSFAVFLVEGAVRSDIVMLAASIIGSMTFIASGLGVLSGLGLVAWLYGWIGRTVGAEFLLRLDPWIIGLVFVITLATSLAAVFPVVRNLLALNPRNLLFGAVEEKKPSRSLIQIAVMSLASFAPLFLLASVLLRRIDQAFMVVGGTFCVFVLISFLLGIGLQAIYRVRSRFSFFVRTIIAQKRADGVFGAVAATSILIAFTSIFSLLLIEKSLERFFDAGIGTTIPSAYVIDVQADQIALVKEASPSVTLFPNIRARIIRIDDRFIQERLQEDNADEDRELRREFNLTYRTELLGSEEVVDGIWQAARTGEVSVEKDFADQAGIRLGSEVEFFIQGINLSARVTSLRSVDRASGLPFFYFVLNPMDIGSFPASSFGYVDLSEDELRTFERTLALSAPNISVLDTSSLGEMVREVTIIMLRLLIIITSPPLLLATLLLATLIAATFASRQRDALHLRVLGATRRTTLSLYLIETIATVLVMNVFGILLAMAIVLLLTRQILDGVQPVYFDISIIVVSLGILGAIVGYASLLLRFRRNNIREEMTYE